MAHTKFAAFPRSVKRTILERIHTAKKSETRAKGAEEKVTQAEVNGRASQWQE